MIEFETLLLLLAIGFVSLIMTLVLFFSGKKVEIEKKKERDIGDVKICKTQIKLVPFLYLIIILIMFMIGIFSDFLFYSIVGIIFALIPFVAYWIFDFKKDGNLRE